jgi:hypothetical protein
MANYIKVQDVIMKYEKEHLSNKYIYTQIQPEERFIVIYIWVRNHVLDYDPREDQYYTNRHKKCHKWRR